jgi:2-hydroxychromene-2-carboxylate isomerase
VPKPPKAEFLFDFGSANAYLAEIVLRRIEGRTGVKFEYVPVLLLRSMRRPAAARFRARANCVQQCASECRSAPIGASPMASFVCSSPWEPQ